jgi:protein TonB
MNISLLRSAVVIAIALLLPGCASTPKVELRPVENRMPPNAPGVYDVSKVTVPPVPTFQARPRYPFELRKAGRGGQGVTLFTVATDGTVKDAMIVQATDVRFGEAALEAVRKWRFRPAQLNGVVVNCRMMVPIVFTLNED